jgi:ABC-2 type transport system ATP-binding protein
MPSDPRPAGPPGGRQAGSDPLVVDGLTKTYPGLVEAVKGISFQVRQGEIFGLLGPNGAGKTTTVGVLTTLIRPTSGLAVVAGHDVTRAPLAVRRSIGVVFQDSVLDNEFTGAENLWLHARLWRIRDAATRIPALLDAVGLSDRANDGVRTYSGGMRRRLEIARALLARPNVLFMDEPTLGLDPIVRRDLWQVVRVLREDHGVTIVLSTHYLEEAQDVCDRVAIIDQGSLVGQGTPGALVSELGNEIVELTVSGDADAALRSLAALEPRLGHVTRAGMTVSIASHEPRHQLTERVNALALAELDVASMTIRPATLNDVFLQLTARASDPTLAAATARRAA